MSKLYHKKQFLNRGGGGILGYYLKNLFYLL